MLITKRGLASGIHDRVFPTGGYGGSHPTKKYFPSAQLAHPRDVPWWSPKGPNVRDLQVTFRGLLGD